MYVIACRGKVCSARCRQAPLLRCNESSPGSRWAAVPDAVSGFRLHPSANASLCATAAAGVGQAATLQPCGASNRAQVWTLGRSGDSRINASDVVDTSLDGQPVFGGAAIREDVLLDVKLQPWGEEIQICARHLKKKHDKVSKRLTSFALCVCSY